MPKINTPAPDFTEDAYVNDEIKRISLKDYRGKWVILFFYPADFTFVCPTELGELADHYDTIKKEGAEVISVSVDTGYVHKAWHDDSPTIKKIKYPMLADPTDASVLSTARSSKMPDYHCVRRFSSIRKVSSRRTRCMTTALAAALTRSSENCRQRSLSPSTAEKSAR